MSQRIDKDDDKIRTASNDFGGSTPTRSTGMAGTGATGAGTTGGSGGSALVRLRRRARPCILRRVPAALSWQLAARLAGGGHRHGPMQAKDFVTEKVKGLQNTDYQKVAEDARDYARQNPGQALLVSAAAGFLLGVLIRGSRR